MKRNGLVGLMPMTALGQMSPAGYHAVTKTGRKSSGGSRRRKASRSATRKTSSRRKRGKSGAARRTSGNRARLVKGSAAAKRYMAKIRKMRK